MGLNEATAKELRAETVDRVAPQVDTEAATAPPDATIEELLWHHLTGGAAAGGCGRSLRLPRTAGAEG